MEVAFGSANEELRNGERKSRLTQKFTPSQRGSGSSTTTQLANVALAAGLAPGGNDFVAKRVQLRIQVLLLRMGAQPGH
jgi:hypothetical protein